MLASPHTAQHVRIEAPSPAVPPLLHVSMRDIFGVRALGAHRPLETLLVNVVLTFQ